MRGGRSRVCRECKELYAWAAAGPCERHAPRHARRGDKEWRHWDRAVGFVDSAGEAASRSEANGLSQEGAKARAQLAASRREPGTLPELRCERVLGGAGGRRPATGFGGFTAGPGVCRE